MRIAKGIAAIAVLTLLLAPNLFAGDKKKKVEIDEANIYYGDVNDFESPAMVDADAVFDEIPEYREIIERDMDESNPRYLVLMRAASKRFRKAISSAAAAKGYDLIGGLGSIKIKGRNVPDITALVIKKLPK